MAYMILTQEFVHSVHIHTCPPPPPPLLPKILDPPDTCFGESIIGSFSLVLVVYSWQGTRPKHLKLPPNIYDPYSDLSKVYEGGSQTSQLTLFCSVTHHLDHFNFSHSNTNKAKSHSFDNFEPHALCTHMYVCILD